ncbi:hypothetical protein FLA_4011 [Filimonas lacunae]|nr:hypothetical protein FLA_4011 [Filimonas lacunae]
MLSTNTINIPIYNVFEKLYIELCWLYIKIAGHGKSEKKERN